MPAVADRNPGHIATLLPGTPLPMTARSGDGNVCCSQQLISMRRHRRREVEEKPRVPTPAER